MPFSRATSTPGASSTTRPRKPTARTLDRYLLAIAASSPDTDPASFESEASRQAYWINAYNAWVIAMVLDA
jgi:hypothetical protein